MEFDMRDGQIREVLRERLTRQHSAETDALIIEELGLCEGSARVDLAVVNGQLNAYEIKSARDTLHRLPHQRDAYGLCFDTVTIVVSSRHIKSARSTVPRWWGILEALATDAGVELRMRRTPKLNRGLQAFAVVQFLWRNEALKILSDLRLDRGLRGKPRDVLWAALTDALPMCDLCDHVRRAIKARGNWRSASRRTSCDGPFPLGAKSLHSRARPILLHRH